MGVVLREEGEGEMAEKTEGGKKDRGGEEESGE